MLRMPEKINLRFLFERISGSIPAGQHLDTLAAQRYISIISSDLTCSTSPSSKSSLWYVYVRIAGAGKTFPYHASNAKATVSSRLTARSVLGRERFLANYVVAEAVRSVSQELGCALVAMAARRQKLTATPVKETDIHTQPVHFVRRVVCGGLFPGDDGKRCESTSCSCECGRINAFKDSDATSTVVAAIHCPQSGF